VIEPTSVGCLISVDYLAGCKDCWNRLNVLFELI